MTMRPSGNTVGILFLQDFSFLRAYSIFLTCWQHYSVSKLVHVIETKRSHLHHRRNISNSNV